MTDIAFLRPVTIISEEEFNRMQQQKSSSEVRKRILERKEQFEKHIILSDKLKNYLTKNKLFVII